VLFDCGNGVLSNLGQIADPLGLDAVFITHNHPDHYADIFALHAMLRYAPDGPRAPMPLYLPEGLFERMKCLLSERGAREFDEAFIPIIIAPGEVAVLGDLHVTAVAVQHTPPTHALIACAEGVRMVYTADTAPCDGVYQAAEGADLLLAEATLPEEYSGVAPHMTAGEAGSLAKDAGARVLVLVHIWPTNDRELMASQAAETFGGPVVVAREFDEFDITPQGGEDD
jgi:ribonuclease BN (tRNA processing enzyme)